jgi:hypothetical protein
MCAGHISQSELWQQFATLVVAELFQSKAVFHREKKNSPYGRNPTECLARKEYG